MSMNGMDVGDETVAGDLPIDVEIPRPRSETTPRIAPPAFSLTQIAPRTPSTTIVREPFVERTSPVAYREAWRNLRFSLERMREASGRKTIGVSSVAPAEGKSLTTVNLALTLVEGGRRRVAVVDACFGGARIAGMLAAEAPIGLAEVLTGAVPLEKALFATEHPGLYALGCGRAPIDPLDVAETFGAVIDRMATVFDFVLVDTPPVGERVDAAALASRLDGMMLVVRSGETKARDLDAAIAKLGEKRVLGLVLNEA